MNKTAVQLPEPVTPQMTLVEIMYQWRASEAVFKAYEARIGVCLCCHHLFDTLAEVAAKHDLDLVKLLADLNALVQILEAAQDGSREPH